MKITNFRIVTSWPKHKKKGGIVVPSFFLCPNRGFIPLYLIISQIGKSYKVTEWLNIYTHSLLGKYISLHSVQHNFIYFLQIMETFRCRWKLVQVYKSFSQEKVLTLIPCVKGFLNPSIFTGIKRSKIFNAEVERTINVDKTTVNCALIPVEFK